MRARYYVLFNTLYAHGGALEKRKNEHLRTCLHEPVEFEGMTAGFERFRFVHQALPDLASHEVDLSTSFLGRRLHAPLIISPMTGGTPMARDINRRLAGGAAKVGIAMGVGSQRAAVEDPALADTYRVRDVAPDIALLANLGAVQLNYGYGVEECQRAVDMIDADGLMLHLNPIQEFLQGEGNRDFRGLLPKIERVCRLLGRPVIVKEVGWGLAPDVVRALFEAGVSAVDVAGAGGTSWGRVEARRSPARLVRQLATVFDTWGMPTAEAIRGARLAVGDGPTIIGSGGIRNGLQAAKALALGANLAGMALPLLRPATVSAEAVAEYLEHIVAELRLAAFASGSRSVEALRKSSLVPVPCSPPPGSTREE
jgi:isopentenyl-diphosphate delta-isomerase